MRCGLRCALFLLVGCGSKTGLPIVEPPARDTGVDVGFDAGFDAPPDVFDAGPSCIPFRAEARLASLDIFLMVDSSGSMEGATSSGITKAEAITDAMRSFVSAPDSTGLGMALTFFPFEDLDVPEFCSNDAQCGMEDACISPDICLPSGSGFCFEDSDCGDGDACARLGRCGMDEFELCLDIGDVCDGDGSRCVDFGFCENRTSCEVGDYASPQVDLGLLPENGSAIVRALETRELTGGTPTLPALQGGIQRAAAWSEENPGSKVIFLLATDGFPAACDPTIDPINPDPMGGIEAPAMIAAEGAAMGIQTFVIGVFAPEEEVDARRNLSQLAVAGGSDEALVVTTDEPVSETLLAILDDLRREVRTCVYAIPAAGVLPDPRELEVRILPPMGPPIELSRVDNEMGCDPMLGGFYFQQDIDMGARPGFVELCPASCSITAASSDFVVEMQGACDE
ncbi:MAG: hypothetical protein AAGE52_07295 [Myxococcota bacterium]